MNPNKDGLPPKADVFSMENERKSYEYQKYMVRMLRDRLMVLLLPSDFYARYATALNFTDSIKNEKDYKYMLEKLDPNSETERKIFEAINKFEYIDDVKAYCELNSIDFDVEKTVREAEKTYMKMRDKIADIKKRFAKYKKPENPN
jgi:hypothetical protein